MIECASEVGDMLALLFSASLAQGTIPKEWSHAIMTPAFFLNWDSLFARLNSPDVTTVFHTWAYGRFIEIQSNPRRKKLHRTNSNSNFLGGSFSNRDNVRTPIQFRREGQHL